MKSDEANVREGIDAEKSEALLRLLKLDVAKEEIRVKVVGDEGLGEEREFEVKGFGMEL